jgi:hypothetical protein
VSQGRFSVRGYTYSVVYNLQIHKYWVLTRIKHAELYSLDLWCRPCGSGYRYRVTDHLHVLHVVCCLRYRCF